MCCHSVVLLHWACSSTSIFSLRWSHQCSQRSGISDAFLPPVLPPAGRGWQPPVLQRPGHRRCHGCLRWDRWCWALPSGWVTGARTLILPSTCTSARRAREPGQISCSSNATFPIQNVKLRQSIRVASSVQSGLTLFSGLKSSELAACQVLWLNSDVIWRNTNCVWLYSQSGSRFLRKEYHRKIAAMQCWTEHMFWYLCSSICWPTKKNGQTIFFSI